MFYKISLLLALIPFMAKSQPLTIKSFLESPLEKVIVIDSTVSDFNKAKTDAGLFFNDSKAKIIPLSEYLAKKEEFSSVKTAFWGLLVKDGLIWNSLAGERADIIKSRFSGIPGGLSVILFGKNPFTNKKALLLASKEEQSLNFNRDLLDDNKSVNAFYKDKLVETAVYGEDFEIAEGESRLLENMSPFSLKPDEVIKDSNAAVYNYSIMGMTVVEISGALDFLFFPENPKPFGQIAKENGFSYQINGSYFAGANLKASHCGILKIYDKVIQPKIMEDQQLKYIFSYDREKKEAEFCYYKNYKLTDDPDKLVFQTGPLVIENNVTADTAIKSSINWARKTKRTLIATLDKKRIFLIIVRENTDMINLAGFLQKLSIFAGGRLDVMNLDGGSSTALYLKNYPRLNYRESARLPLLIGIK
jgi:hypothetical protein